VPEGHTVRRQAREHLDRFAGRPLRVSSPQGRFAPGAALLDGSVMTGTDAHGKHLFLDLAPGGVLHVHLGLYGTWTFGSGEAPPPVGAVRVRLEGAGSWADLRGPTACEVVSPDEQRRILERLGPDPLRRGADPDRAWSRLSRSRAPVGQLLMEQSVVSGVGNVYRAEVLFRAGLDPYRPGRAVTPDEWSGMWGDLSVLMRAGVRTGRIVTTRPEHRERRGRVRPEDAHYVYRRHQQPCRVCGTEVVQEPMAGRNLYRCPACQAA
jgi:DNA-formamidopyrimidine glycosylase